MSKKIRRVYCKIGNFLLYFNLAYGQMNYNIKTKHIYRYNQLFKFNIILKFAENRNISLQQQYNLIQRSFIDEMWWRANCVIITIAVIHKNTARLTKTLMVCFRWSNWRGMKYSTSFVDVSSSGNLYQIYF